MLIKNKISQMLLVCVFLTLMPAVVTAEIPQLINYQGHMTDASNSPINGDKQITFTIYDALGVEKWQEQQEVTVNNGVFNVLLGSVERLPDDCFANDTLLWLGIQVDDDPELIPRIRLITVPFAYHALRADTAKYVSDGSTSGWVDERNIVRLSSLNDSVGVGTTTPQKKLDVTGDIQASDSLIGNNLRLGNSIEGGGITILGGPSEGPQFSIVGEDQNVIFDISAVEDESVILPDKAISNVEILNEAGIAANSSPDEFTYLDTGIKAIESCTINVPSVGFVVIIATTSVQFTFLPGDDIIEFAISTSASSFNRSQFITIPEDGRGFQYAWTVTIHDYFLVTQGSHTFYFLGQRNSGSSHCWAYNPIVSVMFFPTWYGTGF